MSSSGAGVGNGKLLSPDRPSPPPPDGAPSQSEAKGAPKHNPFFVAFNLGLNMLLGTAIVLLNKVCYSKYGFPNMSMTLVHFIFTTTGMVLCKCAGRFEPASVPIQKMLPTAVTFCGFVVLSNLSLENNTVGTAQSVKFLTTPSIMALQALFFGRRFSLKIIMSVVPVIIGVVLNCNYDVKFTQIGLIFAISGVMVTSLYQVMVNETQKEFSISSMQLLYYQAPLSAVMLLCIIPFFEPVTGPGSLLGWAWSMETLALVCGTGIVAFAVNLSIFWIIGNTSPLTYNMVGHFKFCMTLLGGFLVFKDPLQLKQILGLFITFSGIVAYSYIKVQDLKHPADLASSASSAHLSLLPKSSSSSSLLLSASGSSPSSSASSQCSDSVSKSIP